MEVLIAFTIVAGVMALASGATSVGTFIHFKKKIEVMQNDKTTLDITNTKKDLLTESRHEVTCQQKISYGNAEMFSAKMSQQATENGRPNDVAKSLADGAAYATGTAVQSPISAVMHGAGSYMNARNQKKQENIAYHNEPDVQEVMSVYDMGGGNRASLDRSESNGDYYYGNSSGINDDSSGESDVENITVRRNPKFANKEKAMNKNEGVVLRGDQNLYDADDENIDSDGGSGKKVSFDLSSSSESDPLCSGNCDKENNIVSPKRGVNAKTYHKTKLSKKEAMPLTGDEEVGSDFEMNELVSKNNEDKTSHNKLEVPANLGHKHHTHKHHHHKHHKKHASNEESVEASANDDSNHKQHSKHHHHKHHKKHVSIDEGTKTIKNAALDAKQNKNELVEDTFVVHIAPDYVDQFEEIIRDGDAREMMAAKYRNHSDSKNQTDESADLEKEAQYRKKLQEKIAIAFANQHDEDVGLSGSCSPVAGDVENENAA